ncbi:hypothetical protein CY35_01G078000 [Sphagnum magellanicum]|nr:hypothetical protein CY35_01G078000 [Sphagnum magellanicum]
MQQQCAKGVDDVMKAVESGTNAPDSIALHHSNEIINAHKACLSIADEKVSLALKTYDLVDNHIQRLDKDLKKFEEELRRGRGGLLASDPSTEGLAGVAFQEGGDGTKSGRKKGLETLASVNMDLDLPVDPNEPTYCYCGQVSYGEMIACDNPECMIEWFHFDCVGIKERPKGKWYCSDCSALMKQRRAKVSTGAKTGQHSRKKNFSELPFPSE